MNELNEITIKTGVEYLGIFENDRDACVTSRTIAGMFDKEHKSVTRSIRNILENPDDFTARNFAPRHYTDVNGKRQVEWILNRKSFVLVVMGFTGEKAMDFKKRYIDAFESMKTLIETRIISKGGYKIMTDTIKDFIRPDKQWWIYSNEADMVNKIVLGMTSKNFKKLHDCDDVRDNIVKDKLNKLNEAQIFNANLIKAGIDYDKRKEMLHNVYSDEF